MVHVNRFSDLNVVFLFGFFYKFRYLRNRSRALEISRLCLLRIQINMFLQNIIW